MKTNVRRLNEKQIEEIVSLRRQGYPITDVSRVFSVSYYIVRKLCHLYDVGKRGKYKRYAKGGGWVPRIQNLPVFVCDCGVKYIKTRGKDQSQCLFCLGVIKRSNLRSWA